MNEIQAKQKVVDAGIRLVKSGLIARTWGNVSCRISDSHFVITPSGRNYLSLTADDIVTVAIKDLNYTGNIKPSSEKGIHAEIYKYSEDINFVIHTHQENASVVSTLGLDKITMNCDYTFLGNEIICASYGLPGTKKLRRGVSEALKRSKGNAIIMKNHGAVCFGCDDEEAFKTASNLEKACLDFISRQYKKIKGVDSFDADKIGKIMPSEMQNAQHEGSVDLISTYCSSERKVEGFILHLKDSESVFVRYGQSMEKINEEEQIHNEIYAKNKDINYIIHTYSSDILPISRAYITLYPLLDDFAQIVGTKVKTIVKKPDEIANALKHTFAVIIKDDGAFCCGVSEGDATAVEMIMKKNCKAHIFGELFGEVKPISWFDSKLMRVVYLKKYSKQIRSNKIEI
ncbi:L-fuculose-phosphate aldolase [Sedimentibacter acidaminivorans]|uniref:L-fuculose-phosphate aldolase n=1 Tax=Sedimentibacter acidaminivorans TaxID=913099 RepID=A0ABS4GH13_9FIRM|nr:class II aldolase/adducin family protein [Sedimentibacter acidaminivorans]MBP1926977.1 L-fuculose-phosphate aldolase [Sedimentibacter acidaminivorans]